MAAAAALEGHFVDIQILATVLGLLFTELPEQVQGMLPEIVPKYWSDCDCTIGWRCCRDVRETKILRGRTG